MMARRGQARNLHAKTMNSKDRAEGPDGQTCLSKSKNMGWADKTGEKDPFRDGSLQCSHGMRDVNFEF
jgi:hypothetical protein